MEMQLMTKQEVNFLYREESNVSNVPLKNEAFGLCDTERFTAPT